MDYKKKLLDPRWQKKRLEILDRDGWTCQLCDDSKTTLHIHHFRYSKNFNPWEVESEDLTTYCKHCHSLVDFTKYDTHSSYKVIKLEIAAGLFGLASFDLTYDKLFSLYYYDETKGKISYITSLPCDFISSINNYFLHTNILWHG